MATGRFPSFLKTVESRQFWHEKRIGFVEAIRAQAPFVTYVALDCEGQEGHGNGVTSIGLAFLPDACPPQRFETWPWRGADLDEIVNAYHIKSLSLRIEGRHRGRVAEKFRYGRRVHELPYSQLEDYICQHAQAAKQQQQKRLTLVAWGIENEMRAIVSLFPRLLSLLDGWIDPAEITSNMSGIRTQQRRSLRDTLLSFGFGTGYSVQTFSPHDPGMDAIRTAAALAGLVACPFQELVIPHWTQEAKERRQRQQKRPARDEHPYAIRICTQDGSPLPQAISSPDKLETHFQTMSSSPPTAVAVRPPNKPERQKTHGWICFRTLEAMKLFVVQLNG